MMGDHYFKLDNPAWYALKETHACFAIGDDRTKRYHPDIVAFSAYEDGTKSLLAAFDSLIALNESFFIIGDLPTVDNNYIIESILPCVQMICTKSIDIPITEILLELGKADDDAIVRLINEVQPGYYKPGTRLMGSYFGIRQNGQLVAVAGERMRMSGFTEVSAVVTHSGFTGRRYAQQLVSHVVNKNLAAGIIPFLHVSATNERAIKIYELLGFITRRIINFTKLRKIE